MATENKSEVRARSSDNPSIPPLNKGGRGGVTAIIFYITNNGLKLARRIQGLYPDAQVLKFTSVGANGRSPLRGYWDECKSLIFIMAAGIVVRTIASLVKDKNTDPAVVVVDEKGRYAVSLLSGHIGGANRVAEELADFLKGDAVITTASDVQGKIALDMWAAENGLYIEDAEKLKKLSAKIVNGKRIRVKLDRSINAERIPDEFVLAASARDAELIATYKVLKSKALFLRPKTLVIGIGCNRETSKAEIEKAIKKVLQKGKLAFNSIRDIATIDIKKDEEGLMEFANENNLHINYFSKTALNKTVFTHALETSETVKKATGALAVAEPAALLSAGSGKLLVHKQKIGNVTVAVAEKNKCGSAKARKAKSEIQNPKSEITGSKLYIVGTGPGSIEHITPRAQDVIRKSDVIVGYGTYLDLIRELLEGKEVISTGMTQETDRCKKAVELALSGKTVSIISGGDPGIYAMAGLVFEVLSAEALKRTSAEVQKRGSVEATSELPNFRTSKLSVEVIPGVSALNACAARLGAPLMHDFASISLSDRLTPWKLIEKRLESAAMADFVIVLYNPKSKGRPEHINKAQEIIMKYRDTDAPVGIVKGAMRENEEIVITNLKNMLKHDIDMQTTVIIGNSQTFVWDNLMITPRGYERKFKIK